MADRTQVAHVLRRAAFGPTAAEVDAAAGGELRETVRSLVAPLAVDAGAAPLPTFATDPYLARDGELSREDRAKLRREAQKQLTDLAEAWLRRMATARDQLTEKMVFFWHGHWATSAQKVRSATLMRGQLETFRAFGRADFAKFAKAMVRDPALILWLDGQRNTRQAPNENLARELMELFTLGVGAYTEADVKAGARALTGWTIDRTTGTARFARNRFAQGDKTILGSTADFDADSYVDLLVGHPDHAKFLARRLWYRFGSAADLPSGTQDAMLDAYGAGRDVNAMLAAMFTDERFLVASGQLVKQPVEWAVGAVRQLGIEAPEKLLNGVRAMGQAPLRPPSVGGWPGGASWLTTSSLQVRMKIAGQLAAALPEKTTALLRGATTTKLEALAHLLVVDGWTDRTRAALADAAAKPHRLVALALISPEYTVC